MKDVWIRLSSTKDVQQFVATLVPLQGDFEFVGDHLFLDARSLMGIFGLDLTRPLRLRMHIDNPKNLAAIEPYRVDMEETNHE